MSQRAMNSFQIRKCFNSDRQYSNNKKSNNQIKEELHACILLFIK